MTLSIRARVTAAFVLLISMALVETGFVLYVQRASQTAFSEAVRTESILSDHGALRAALLGMQAAQRGYAIALDARELTTRAEMRTDYERLLTQIRPLIRDHAQRQRLERIEALVVDWESISQELIVRAMGGEDTGPIIMNLASPRFQVIQREMVAFEQRQRELTRAAVATGDAHIQRATIALTLIPLVAVVFMIGLLIATQRTILRPLADVARTARRMGSGDYDAPLPDARDDEIGALVGAFRDMRSAVHSRAREAVQANDRLKEAHGELMAIMNAAPAGIVVVAPDGAVRLANKAAEFLLGTVPDDPTARKAYWQSFKVRDGMGRSVRIRDIPPVRALAGTSVAGEELDVTRSDGRRVEVLVGAVALHDAAGAVTGAVAGFQDITRLRELDRMKDEFVAIVSHELRTPLTAIRGSLQLLLADNAVASDEHRELLSVASSSCERLVRIVNDMLDLSKIEAGRLELRLTTVSIEALVSDACAAVRPLAEQAGVTLASRVDPVLPPWRGDLDRLTQALVNLLSNAIKFAPPGTTISIGARALDDTVALSVSNEGRGISAEEIPRLFQKFEQLDSAGTRRKGGTGLGLVITKGIVEQHGGHIAVESVPGQGTTFTITIPSDQGAAAAPAPAATVRRVSRPGQHTILVAEDDEETRTVLRITLERHGFYVLEAKDGAEAISIASAGPLDALLLDLRMPRVHGHDVIRSLRRTAATATLPIVVVSGSESEQHSLQSLLLGANTFIVKPADSDALVSEIVRHIGPPRPA